MPKTCCVAGCKSRSGRDDVSFFRIPNINDTTGNINIIKRRRREAWIKAIGGEVFSEKQINYARVCSTHFISGKPCADEYDTYPDWVPTKNLMLTKKVKKTIPAHSNKRKKQYSRIPRSIRMVLFSSKDNDSSAKSTQNSQQEFYTNDETDRENNVTISNRHLTSNEDEVEIIEKSWALKYIKLEPEQQIFAMKAINDILYEAQLGTLNKHSVVINGNDPTDPLQVTCVEKFNSASSISDNSYITMKMEYEHN